MYNDILTIMPQNRKIVRVLQNTDTDYVMSLFLFSFSSWSTASYKFSIQFRQIGLSTKHGASPLMREHYLRMRADARARAPLRTLRHSNLTAFLPFTIVGLFLIMPFRLLDVCRKKMVLFEKSIGVVVIVNKHCSQQKSHSALFTRCRVKHAWLLMIYKV